MDKGVPSIWESAFVDKRTMWGFGPTRAALAARDLFVERGARSVLIPGVGYGRNAKPFLDAGMRVTGIEISETAIGFARTELALAMPIHHGSVTDMPFDEAIYDGIFCFGLLYLLDAAGRAKLLADCLRQLAPDGSMIFTVISKAAPMYAQGPQLGEDWYERHPGMPMYFYDEASIAREFGPFCLIESAPIAEPMGETATLPFWQIVCRKDGRAALVNQPDET